MKTMLYSCAHEIHKVLLNQANDYGESVLLFSIEVKLNLESL